MVSRLLEMIMVPGADARVLDGRFVQEDARHVDVAIDLFIQPLPRLSRANQDEARGAAWVRRS